MAETQRIDLRLVQEGTPVATADGATIGVIGNILAEVPDLWPLDLGGARSLFGTPTPGGYGAGENAFFLVQRRDGAPEPRPLYVPIDAILEAGPTGVRLSVRREEVEAQGWSRRPAGHPGD
ncbi:MAG: hypothetical protein HY689_08085 [Chloroflexi bacterium]|nr:hypothetical protein [Chloroflexota bacterium]